jgi:leucyl/phenylalanyl-tRNA--protein transferase
MVEELKPEILLSAYANGIFPMADENGEISWFCPDPRAIIELDRFTIPRSLKQRLRRGDFEIKYNTCFERVIRCCADREDGTWISRDIIQSYSRLHELGHAHSVETFYGTELAGGLYGVSLGGAFFGESMFTDITDGSKLALVALVDRMKNHGMSLLDTQFLTPHLQRFGAVEIPRADYLQRLEAAMHLDASFMS